MAALDHTAFPHLLDAILAYASRPVLLALRQTSHHFRTLADTHLCAHAELHLTATPSWRLVSSSGPLPLIPGDTHASCLAAIQTLTLRTPASQRRMARKDLLLPALYLPAHTLRLPDPFVRLSIDGLAPDATNLVVFEEVGRSFNCDKTGWFFPPTIAGTRIPDWARRYVLNIGVRPDEPELHAASWETFAVLDDDGRPLLDGGAREVTVILRGLPARPARALQTAQHDLGLLHGLAEAVAAHPGWRWTVVGVPELMATAPQAVPTKDKDVFARFEEVAGARVRFSTLAEYARIRGPGAALEIQDERPSTTWYDRGHA